MPGPYQCSFGHNAVDLADDTAVDTHLTSSHASDDPATVRAALTNPAGGDDALALPVITGALAKFAIKGSHLKDRKASTLCSGPQLTDHRVVSFCNAFAKKRGINLDLGFFFIDFLMLVLNSASSEEVSIAGGFTPYDMDGQAHDFVSWEDFHGELSMYCQSYHQEFTLRKMQYALDEQLWEVWSDTSIEALSDVRNNSTALARKFFDSSGTVPKAYVPVPGLFVNHLTKVERDTRIYIAGAVSKLSGDVSDLPGTLALDPEKKADISNATRSAVRSATAGVGASSRTYDPGAEWLQKAYPHFGKTQEFVRSSDRTG